MSESLSRGVPCVEAAETREQNAGGGTLKSTQAEMGFVLHLARGKLHPPINLNLPRLDAHRCRHFERSRGSLSKQRFDPLGIRRRCRIVDDHTEVCSAIDRERRIFKS
jgi:hypothetical protein